MIYKEAIKRNVNVIFIEGDLYDTTIQPMAEEIYYIDSFIVSFLHFCKTHQITIKIVKGTHRHDNEQLKKLVWYNDIMQLGVRVTYCDSLTVEYDEVLDIYTLFIPDEWLGKDTEATYKAAKAAIEAKGISRVDFILMHGMFDYQLPSEYLNIPHHISKRYQNLTQGFVLCGHVHTHSLHGNIVVAGSYDRLKHGQEEPKGMIALEYGKHGKSCQFIENTHAKIFKTITIDDVGEDDSEQAILKAMKKIDDTVKDYPSDSYIRIRAPKDHPIYVAIKEIAMKYPNLHLEIENAHRKKVTPYLQNDGTKDILQYQAISITPANIEALVSEELRNNGYNEKDIEQVISILKEQNHE